MISLIDRLLVDRVTVQARAGVENTAGDPAFNAPAEVRARVERGAKWASDAGGEEVRSDATIWTLTEIHEGDRLWLPGDEDPRTVLEVAESRDFSGRKRFFRARV